MGSVFSPYYAWQHARRGAAVDPDDHCALNVALYGAGGKRWTMTERGRSRVQRDREQFTIGPSRVRWLGDHLRIDIDERGAPLPRRVRGTVRVYPAALCRFNTALDAAGRHRWGPIAPGARVTVALDHPRLQWQGEGYLDSNEGDEPVDRPFQGWDWSRARLRDGSTAVLYDLRELGGGTRVIAERFMPDGSHQPFMPPPQVAMPGTLWQIDRHTRADVPQDGSQPARLAQTLEDTPFYARSLVDMHLCGERVTAVHETLTPQRLKAWPMRFMLPWRMPRLA